MERNFSLTLTSRGVRASSLPSTDDLCRRYIDLHREVYGHALVPAALTCTRCGPSERK